MPKEMVIVKLLLAKFIMVHHILEIKPTGDDKEYIPGKHVSTKCCKYSGLLDCKVELSCQFPWLRHHTKNVNNKYCHILGKNVHIT